MWIISETPIPHLKIKWRGEKKVMLKVGGWVSGRTDGWMNSALFSVSLLGGT
jgi:hypothetical protein